MVTIQPSQPKKYRCIGKSNTEICYVRLTCNHFIAVGEPKGPTTPIKEHGCQKYSRISVDEFRKGGE